MSGKRRALVIGGSMSGLLAGIMLARRGWDVDIFERVEKELAGRGAGIVAQTELIARMDALGPRHPRPRCRHDDAQDPRQDRPDGAHARMPAGAHRLGARLSPAARCLSAGALSSRQRLEGVRPKRAGRRCAFQRRQHGRWRRAHRRRRLALDRTPALRPRCRRRSMPAMWPGARFCPKAPSRRRSIASSSWT